MQKGGKTLGGRRKPVILDHDTLRAAEKFLQQADPVLGGVIETLGPCPLCDERAHDPFMQLCTAIIGQQLSVKAAHTIQARALELLGDFTPRAILEAEDEELRSCGLSRPKIRYLKALSRMVRDGELKLESLTDLRYEEVLSELLKVPGIGQWTAEMFLLFNLKHSNVLALADVGLQRAVRVLYGPKASLEKVGKKWAPYCSVASWYLWQSLDANLLGDKA